MRFVRSADLTWVPWKNRGGVIADIAASPDGADWDNVAWRVSFARVEREGPFSHFPDIDRTMVLLAGAGLDLIGSDGSQRHVAVGATPVVFPGDLPVVAKLTAGPIDNLNVMVRRGRLAAHVARINPHQAIATLPDAVASILVVEHGSLVIPHQAPLIPRDAVVNNGTIALAASSAALIAISIVPARA